jgi:hypothetical protein
MDNDAHHFVLTFLHKESGPIKSRKESKDLFQESVQTYEFIHVGIEDGFNTF